MNDAPKPAPAPRKAPKPVSVTPESNAPEGAPPAEVATKPGVLSIETEALHERNPEVVAPEDHSHLPESVREEIAAGRRGLDHHRGKTSAEHIVGQKMVAQHHSRAHFRGEPSKPVSVAFPPNPESVNKADRKIDHLAK